jgi:hypothetical protein
MHKLLNQIDGIRTALRKRQAEAASIQNDRQAVTRTRQDDPIHNDYKPSPENSLDNNKVKTIYQPDFNLEIQHLEGLLRFLEHELALVNQKKEDLKHNITFDLLWSLFPVGSEITFKDHNSALMSAGKVRRPCNRPCSW